MSFNGFAKEYKFGDKGPGGGYIFFVNYNHQYPGFTYLEAAPGNASDLITWRYETGMLIGLQDWDKHAVGRGRANTDAMLSNCHSGAAYSANEYSTRSTSHGD